MIWRLIERSLGRRNVDFTTPTGFEKLGVKQFLEWKRRQPRDPAAARRVAALLGIVAALGGGL